MGGTSFSGWAACGSRAAKRRPLPASQRGLLSTSALAGSALRGLVLASGAAAGAVLMVLPADAFTCVNSSLSNAGATDNGFAGATACGPLANADGSDATAVGASANAIGRNGDR